MSKYYIITEYLDGFIPLNQTRNLFSVKEENLIFQKIKHQIEILHKKYDP